MILFPNCKINLGLDVLGRRADCYHNIATVMYPVRSLCDSIELVRRTDDRICFTHSGIAVDCCDDKNLVLQAYKLLRGRYGLGGADIHLHKLIPFGAGIGGGSADAAAMLKAVNTLYDLHLSQTQLEEWAAMLGSDTPFFIRNTPQFCTSRGEHMTPYDIDLSGHWLVLIKPPFGISTAEAYGGITPHAPATALADRLAQPIATWREHVTNAFEQTVFALHHELSAIKEMLYDRGAVYASMSGSGSAMYGLFDNQPEQTMFSKTTCVPNGSQIFIIEL